MLDNINNNKNNDTNLNNVLAQLENIYTCDFKENIVSPFFNIHQVNTYCNWVRNIIKEIKILPECCGNNEEYCLRNDLVVSSGHDRRFADYFIKLKYTKFNFGENKNIKYLMIYFYGNYDVSIEEKIVDKNDKIKGIFFSINTIGQGSVDERINQIVREWMEK